MWFVTGAGRGMGASLTRAALAALYVYGDGRLLRPWFAPTGSCTETELRIDEVLPTDHHLERLTALAGSAGLAGGGYFQEARRGKGLRCVTRRRATRGGTEVVL